MTEHIDQTNDTSESQGIAGELNTETKFMHQYRIAAAAHGKGKIMAVRNSIGQVEIFTVGTNGTVWNYYPDPSSPTGYSQTETGLVLDKTHQGSLDVGVDSGGRVFVFATISHSVWYAVKTGREGDRNWRHAQTNLHDSGGQERVAHARNIGGSLYVGVLTLLQPSNALCSFDYALIDSSWSGNFTSTPLSTGTLFGEWTGVSDVVEFGSVDQGYFNVVRYNIKNGSLSKVPLQPFKGIIPYATASANNEWFAILHKDSNIYQLSKAGNNLFAWKSITQDALTKGLNLYQVVAETDAAGAIHVFALGGDANVYHLAPNPNGGWLDPTSIEVGVRQIAVATNDAGNIELFLIGTAQDVVTRKIRNSETGDWEDYKIEIPSAGPEHVEEFISYSTDISVLDAAGALMPNAEVKLRASAQTDVIVNGKHFFIDAHTPAGVRTNSIGMLSVTQETDTLGVAALEVEVVGPSLDSKPFGVRQFEGVRDDLKKVKTEELRYAKDKNGVHLLPQELIDKPKEVDALRQAINNCMGLPPRQSLDATGLSIQARKLGVGWCPGGVTEHLNRLGVPDIQTHWQLDFSDGKIVCRELTAEAARTLVADMQAQSVDATGFFARLYDFVAGIYNGIYQVLTLTYEAGVATFNFFWKGVKHIFSVVVEFFEQAFGLVESIFASIKVTFERLFEWLGFVFNWEDILLTRTAVRHTVNQFLAFMKGAEGGIKMMIDNGITSAKGQIDETFGNLIKSIGADATPGGYAKRNEPNKPAVASATANNLLLNAIMANAGSASLSSLPVTSTTDVDTDFDELFTKVKEIAQRIEHRPEYADAIKYITNLGGSPDEIFKQLLSGLLKFVQGLMKGVLDGVQIVVDTLLDILAAIIGQLESILNKRWNIPFVSDFYAWLTKTKANPKGDPLTLLDLSSLMIAIPATTLYKVVKGTAPFTEKSLGDFEKTFTAQMMLHNAGFSKTSAPPSAETDNEFWRVFLPFCGMCGGVGYAAFTGLLDFQEMVLLTDPSDTTRWLSKVALGCELFAQACAFPATIYSNVHSGCNNAVGASWLLFLYECIGVLLDASCVLSASGKEAMPENNNTMWGLAIATLYGMGHATLVGFCFNTFSGSWSKASNVLIVIPECLKWLRILSPNKIALGVIAGIDVVGIAGSAVTGFIGGLANADTAEIPYPQGAVRLATYPLTAAERCQADVPGQFRKFAPA